MVAGWKPELMWSANYKPKLFGSPLALSEIVALDVRLLLEHTVVTLTGMSQATACDIGYGPDKPSQMSAISRRLP